MTVIFDFYADNVVRMKKEPFKNGDTGEERPPFDFRPVPT